MWSLNAHCMLLRKEVNYLFYFTFPCSKFAFQIPMPCVRYTFSNSNISNNQSNELLDHMFCVENVVIALVTIRNNRIVMFTDAVIDVSFIKIWTKPWVNMTHQSVFILCTQKRNSCVLNALSINLPPLRKNEHTLKWWNLSLILAYILNSINYIDELKHTIVYE